MNGFIDHRWATDFHWLGIADVMPMSFSKIRFPISELWSCSSEKSSRLRDLWGRSERRERRWSILFQYKTRECSVDVHKQHHKKIVVGMMRFILYAVKMRKIFHFIVLAKITFSTSISSFRYLTGFHSRLDWPGNQVVVVRCSSLRCSCSKRSRSTRNPRRWTQRISRSQLHRS